MRLSWDKIIIDDLNRWPFIAVVFLIAAAHFFSIFDLAFISQGNLWRYGHGDPGQHLIGFLYFVQDEWRFPLFHTQNLGYPHGNQYHFYGQHPSFSAHLQNSSADCSGRFPSVRPLDFYLFLAARPCVRLPAISLWPSRPPCRRCKRSVCSHRHFHGADWDATRSPVRPVSGCLCVTPVLQSR